MNHIGPGQYQLPNLTGRKNITSKNKNGQMFSMRSKGKIPVYHPGLEDEFVGSQSPEATKYSPKVNYLSKYDSTKSLAISTTPKYQQPSSITNLRASVPVQYTAADGVSSHVNTLSGNLADTKSSTFRAQQALARMQGNR
jgi:hypothetical protein